VSRRLEGKVALVTGAARGQGRSHVLRMAAEGANIIGIDICADDPDLPYRLASKAELDELVAKVEGLGQRMSAHVADVGDRAALQSAVDDGVGKLGGLDIVVANAAIFSMGEDKPTSLFFRVVNTCLVGSLNTISCADPHLRDGASIILIGSVGAFVPGATGGPMAGPGAHAYTYAKHCVPELVQSLANMYSSRMIRVNGLHPTCVATPMMQNDRVYAAFRPDLDKPSQADAYDAFVAFNMLPVPWVEPEDVTNSVVFLASDESRYVTGSHMRVDAGALAKALPASL
jgi:SDR family mycofactocin-dependent oxidoreductase